MDSIFQNKIKFFNASFIEWFWEDRGEGVRVGSFEYIFIVFSNKSRAKEKERENRKRKHYDR